MINEDTYIITTNRDKFFEYEMPHFLESDIVMFKLNVRGLEASCNRCGVYYWKVANKRCNCK